MSGDGVSLKEKYRYNFCITGSVTIGHESEWVKDFYKWASQHGKVQSIVCSISFSERCPRCNNPLTIEGKCLNKNCEVIQIKPNGKVIETARLRK